MFIDVYTYILRIPFTVAEPRRTDKLTQNVLTKFTLKGFVRGIHESFKSGLHLHFGTGLKIWLWDLGTCRQNCAPIQCTVWPRNGVCFSFFLYFFPRKIRFHKYPTEWVE